MKKETVNAFFEVHNQIHALKIQQTKLLNMIERLTNLIEKFHG